MEQDATTLEQVLVAQLSVYNWSMERVWKLLPALRHAGLTNPESFPVDLGKTTVALYEAGYDRGMLTEMFAERAASLMAFAQSGELDPLDDLVAAGKKEEAVKLLLRIRGIGAMSAKNAWLLLSSG